MSRKTAAFGSILLLANCRPALAQTMWDVVNTFHIGGEGGWGRPFITSVDRDPNGDKLFTDRRAFALPGCGILLFLRSRSAASKKAG